jgi:hypothetical protein
VLSYAAIFGRLYQESGDFQSGGGPAQVPLGDLVIVGVPLGQIVTLDDKAVPTAWVWPTPHRPVIVLGWRAEPFPGNPENPPRMGGPTNWLDERRVVMDLHTPRSARHPAWVAGDSMFTAERLSCQSMYD